MNRLLLPALLASLMLQVAPVSAATSASATIDWNSLNIQLIDLSGGTDAPVLTWTSMTAQSYSSAYTPHPSDSQYSELNDHDFAATLNTSASTLNAQASAVHDAMTLNASSSAQPGTVPMWWGPGYYNIAYAVSLNYGNYTLTGHGVAVFTLDWSATQLGNSGDHNNYSYSSIAISSSYSDGHYNNGNASSGYNGGLFDINDTSSVGSFATNGSFAMAVLNTSPNGTSGLFNAQAYTYSQSYNQPVPEPETYALMLAGLGLVGFMARRRKV